MSGYVEAVEDMMQTLRDRSAAYERLTSENAALRARVAELEAETVRRGKMLVRLRDKLINICDGLEDQGDLVALRSTNDADDFREAVRELDSFKWGLILAEDDKCARAALRAKGGE